MNGRAALKWSGRKLMVVVSVIFFTAAALAVLASFGFALLQSAPIWAPLAMESAAESEEELTDEGEE